jgi:hypothetical protein
MSDTYELFDQLRKDMDAAGDTPQGRLAMALVQLDERLRAIEKWHDYEQDRAQE